jgi:hypothetical protein
MPLQWHSPVESSVWKAIIKEVKVVSIIRRSDVLFSVIFSFISGKFASVTI